MKTTQDNVDKILIWKQSSAPVQTTSKIITLKALFLVLYDISLLQTPKISLPEISRSYLP